MSIEQRDQAISTLELQLNTRVISYCTSDRPGMEAQIGMDAIPRFRRHLEGIGDVPSIALFLYSRGGDTNVPWRLVSLFREYCRDFTVLVPFRAHSAASLICLGADRIVMARMAELSSIDPSVANAFNPQDPLNPMARIPISVEDVNAYKGLAERFGLKDLSAEEGAKVFLELASKINPLALGNVERNYKQIRKLAGDLLDLHADAVAKGAKENVIKTLTEELYSHGHMINRREAKRIGLGVVEADRALEIELWRLYSDYANEMELEKPFNAVQALGNQSSVRISLRRAIIESRAMTDAFVSEGLITRHPPGSISLPPGMQLPPGVQPQIQVAFQVEFEGWKQLR